MNVGRASKPLGVGADGGFVLAVRTYRQGRFGEDAFQCVLLIDQQVSRAAANENFDPRDIGRLGKLVDVVGSRTDVKAVVDQRLAGRNGVLRGDTFDGHGRRFRVRHF